MARSFGRWPAGGGRLSAIVSSVLNVGAFHAAVAPLPFLQAPLDGRLPAPQNPDAQVACIIVLMREKDNAQGRRKNKSATSLALAS